MKKLSLLILGLTFTLSLSVSSCSNDLDNSPKEDSSVIDFQLKSGNDLKTLYDAMVASQDYIEYEIAVKDFSAKMRFDGQSSDIDTEAKLLSWISTNISDTGFTNFTEAQDKWDDIVARGEILVDDNESLFLEIGNNTAGDFQAILPEPGVEPAANPCQEACASAFNSTMASVMSEFTSAVQAASDAFTLHGNGHALAVSFGLAITDFRNCSEEAAVDYVDCIIPC